MVVTLDSGKRQQFDTGARRDTSEGKPRFDLIPFSLLDELQHLYGGEYVQDVQHGEPFTGEIEESEVRRDLIPDLLLNRLGGLLKRGADKYDAHNWQKGMPLSRWYESLERHEKLLRAGDTKEDHLAAIVFNAMGYMWTEREIAKGRLPDELADFGALGIYLGN